MYELRPRSCQTFSCVWLQGELEDEHRPDKLGAVMATADLDDDLQILIAWITRPGADTEETTKDVLTRVAQVVPVAIQRRDGTRSLLIVEHDKHLAPRIYEALNARATVDEKGDLRRLPIARES